MVLTDLHCAGNVKALVDRQSHANADSLTARVPSVAEARFYAGPSHLTMPGLTEFPRNAYSRPNERSKHILGMASDWSRLSWAGVVAGKDVQAQLQGPLGQTPTKLHCIQVSTQQASLGKEISHLRRLNIPEYSSARDILIKA